MDRSDGTDASDREHRLRFSTANELFEEFPAVREDMQAEPTEQDCLAFLRGLAASATPEEAITFAAYLLPPREAVWWAHQCLNYRARRADRARPCRCWPSPRPGCASRTRRRATPRSRRPTRPRPKTPGVWVAFAAGWSGGTMGPLDVSPVPPPPFLTPRAVNAGVLGLLARVETEHRDETLRGFVEMAVKLTEA